MDKDKWQEKNKAESTGGKLPQSNRICTWVLFIYFFLFVVNFVIHWNETAMGLHVFPIPIPPPTSLSTRST